MSVTYSDSGGTGPIVVLSCVFHAIPITRKQRDRYLLKREE